MNLELLNLAGRINAQCEQAEAAARSAIEHAWEAGKLLLEAKASVRHGEWRAWCESNLRVKYRQLAKYMQLHEGYKSALQCTFASIDEAVGALPKRVSAPQPAKSVEAMKPPMPVDEMLRRHRSNNQPAVMVQQVSTSEALKYFGLSPLTGPTVLLVIRARLQVEHPDKGGADFNTAKKFADHLRSIYE
jgi:Protein of unknown function (DUF3102)